MLYFLVNLLGTRYSSWKMYWAQIFCLLMFWSPGPLSQDPATEEWPDESCQFPSEMVHKSPTYQIQNLTLECLTFKNPAPARSTPPSLNHLQLTHPRDKNSSVLSTQGALKRKSGGKGNKAKRQVGGKIWDKAECSRNRNCDRPCA